MFFLPLFPALLGYYFYQAVFENPVPPGLEFPKCHEYGLAPFEKLLNDLTPLSWVNNADAMRQPSWRSKYRSWCFDNPPTSELHVVFSDGTGREILEYKDKGAVDVKSKNGKRKTVVYIHGGGFVIGSPEGHSGPLRTIMDGSASNLMFVRYRFAPENLFPTSVDDAVFLVKWIFDNSDSLGVDKHNVHLLGGSAGGNLVLNVALELMKQGDKYPLKGVHSVYPVVNVMHDVPSMKQYQTDPTGFLNKADMSRFMIYYFLGDLSCIEDYYNNNHVSAKALKQYSEVIKKHNLTELANGANLHPENWNASSGVCAEKLEAKLLDGRANLVLTSEEQLRSLEKTKVVVYTCETDVLRDDAYLFTGLLTSLRVPHIHVYEKNCYHGAIVDNTVGGKNLRGKIVQELNKS